MKKKIHLILALLAILYSSSFAQKDTLGKDSLILLCGKVYCLAPKGSTIRDREISRQNRNADRKLYFIDISSNVLSYPFVDKNGYNWVYPLYGSNYWYGYHYFDKKGQKPQFDSLQRDSIIFKKLRDLAIPNTCSSVYTRYGSDKSVPLWYSTSMKVPYFRTGKLSNKYPYIDLYLDAKKIGRRYKGAKKYRGYYGYLVRILLVDSLIYEFSSQSEMPNRGAKKTFKAVKKEFDVFVNGIFIKKEEDLPWPKAIF